MFLIRLIFPYFKVSKTKALNEVNVWLQSKETKDSLPATDYIPFMDNLAFQQYKDRISKKMGVPESELELYRSTERTKLLYRPFFILFFIGMLYLGINLFLEIQPYLGKSRLEKPFIENLLPSGKKELVEMDGSFCRYMINNASEIAEDYFYIGWYLFSIGSICTFLGSIMDSKHHGILKIALPFVGLFILSIAWKIFDNSKLAGLAAGRSMLHYNEEKDADKKCRQEWANLRQGIANLVPSGIDTGDASK
ncbi:hypothetical protein [Leptospira johnsonii]|uniref:Uncharacterized protein n=1 Tax=Leptospira johnsonii TaxID=1917820 RepID=A0A2P2D3G1_9LEPT|nr:hypothetical protein [Leptospira johnsonii]GBF39031.1 hypothetical protein LPTSP1_20260 [Leptospira johnsonii]